jgi:hypothetical protein
MLTLQDSNPGPHDRGARALPKSYLAYASLFLYNIVEV